MDQEVAKTLGELEIKLQEVERELTSIGRRDAQPSKRRRRASWLTRPSRARQSERRQPCNSTAADNSTAAGRPAQRSAATDRSSDRPGRRTSASRGQRIRRAGGFRRRGSSRAGQHDRTRFGVSRERDRLRRDRYRLCSASNCLVPVGRVLAGHSGDASAPARPATSATRSAATASRLASRAAYDYSAASAGWQPNRQGRACALQGEAAHTTEELVRRECGKLLLPKPPA